MKTTLGITAAMVAWLALAPVPKAPASESGDRPFQLVYNSDTRGYYRPCG